jgi:hypothetical protein
MTDALAVLLLTWNSAFYRGATFKKQRMEQCLRKHWQAIQSFKRRDISTFDEQDHVQIQRLFLAMLGALERRGGRSRRARTPVGVAKALHLLAPGFFPIWDSEIAWQYGCDYTRDPVAAYLQFCGHMKRLASGLRPKIKVTSPPLLKRIDEYNYAKFTQGWV